MQLFHIENKVAKPTPEVLLIEPFKTIWERDTSEHKTMAIKEFSYIEFMCSPKKTNPFHGYEEALREKKIVENIFGTPYVPDEMVRRAIALYKEFFYKASPTLRNLESARIASDKLNLFLQELDLDERNKSGSPLYKPKDITTALADTFNVAKTLNSLQERVEQEIFETFRTKNNREVNPFEK